MAVLSTEYLSNPFSMIKPSSSALGINIGTLFALLGIQLIPVGIILLALIVGVLGHSSAALVSISFAMGAVAIIAIIALLLLSVPTYTVIILSSVRGEKIALRPALSAARPFVWRMLWMQILTILAVIGGLILFIIPGLIFIAWFSVSQYVMISEQLGSVASMKRSRQLVRGRVWEMWSLSLVPSVASAVPVLGSILNFILGIMMIPATGLRYMQLAATAPEDRPKVHWSNYALIGFIIVSGIAAASLGLGKTSSSSQPATNSLYNYGSGPMNWTEHNLIRSGDIVSIAAWQELKWLKQGFSLRGSGNIAYRFGDATSARKSISEELGFVQDQWTAMQQVHGNHVELVEKADIGKGSKDYESAFAETDGLVTNQNGALLAVVVADCVPLLFVDPVTKNVAVAHAGRRGTEAEIAKITFSQLLKCGSRAEDIQVAIGPSIGPCCYEIDPDTHQYFDLWASNEQQLREVGAKTIIRTNLCTKDHNDLFFSHRADDQPGRFAGLIGVVS